MRRGVSGLISVLVILFVSVSMLSTAILLHEKMIEAGERQAEKMRAIAEEAVNPAPLALRASQRLQVSVHAARVVEVKMFIIEYANGTLLTAPGAVLEPGRWHDLVPYSCEPVRVYAVYSSGVIARWSSQSGARWFSCTEEAAIYDPAMKGWVIGMRAPPASSHTVRLNVYTAISAYVSISEIDRATGRCYIDNRLVETYNATKGTVRVGQDELLMNLVADCSDPAALWIEFRLRSGRPFTLRGEATVQISTRYYIYTSGPSYSACRVAASPYVPYGSYTYSISFSGGSSASSYVSFSSSFSTSNIIFLYANAQRFTHAHEGVSSAILVGLTLRNITIYEPGELEIALPFGSSARALRVKLEGTDRFSAALFKAFSHYEHLPDLIEEGGSLKIKARTSPGVPAVLRWEGRVERCEPVIWGSFSEGQYEGSASLERPASLLSPWKAPMMIEVSLPEGKRLYVIDPDGSLSAGVAQGGRLFAGYAPLLSHPFSILPPNVTQIWVPVQIDEGIRYSGKALEAPRMERYSYHVLILLSGSSAAMLVRTA